MTLPILLLLVALGALSWRLRRRRLGGALLVLALVCALAAGCGLLPRLLIPRLQNGWPAAFTNWGQRNVIVLLGGNMTRTGRGHFEPGTVGYGRIDRALELYRDCKSAGEVCRIEISGGDAAGLGEPVARVYGHELRLLGVPASDLMLETRSMNTWQNAQFSAPLLNAFAPDRIVLVTSATHLWRARLCFEHFGIHVDPVRANYLYTSIGLLPQAANLELTDIALHEYLGVAYYRLLWALGWKHPI